ncbi:hypothetical protein GCM10027053_24520 [Intrasporangium mesophilum]
MTDSDAAVLALARDLASAVTDLSNYLSGPVGLRLLLSDVGHAVPDGVDLSSGLAKVSPLVDSIGALVRALAAFDPQHPEVGGEALLSALLDVSREVAELTSSAPPAALPPPWNQPEAWGELAASVLGHVVYDAMELRIPGFLSALNVLGVARPRVVDQTGASVVSPSRIMWDKIPALVSDPVGHLVETYGWDSTPNVPLLVDSAMRIAIALGLPVTLYLDETALGMFWDLGNVDPARTITGIATAYRFTQGTGPLASSQTLSLALFGIPDDTRRGQVKGFALAAQASGAVSAAITITDSVTLTLAGGLQAGVAIAFRPGKVGLTTSTGGSLAGNLSASLLARPAAPWAFGDPQGTRIETSRLAAVVKAAASTSTGSEPELTVSVDGDFTAYLDLSGGDSFVTALLGDETHELPFTAGVVWSSRTGLHFVGGPPGGPGASGMSTTIPLNLDLAGVLHLSGLTLDVGPAESGAAIEALATGHLSLGPFTVTFKGLGLSSVLDAPADGTGNLGPLDLRLGLAGPEAIGLSINATAVTGGGYLDADHDAGTYIGVAELTIAGTVSVKAIGIITTRMPDGRDGFALLLLITAEGFTPVQLGLGFTLTGIGGLIALNRTVDADAVRGGLKDGILDSILFVKDPVKNADRVVASLDTVFPLARDRLVVGPLAEISWGTPAIVHLRLALLLDLPMPVRAILLAALSVTLPKPEAPVVEIHVDAIGVLDLGKGQLALDASLHDSRIIQYTLTGDMSLRMDWGTQPGFLLSIGGFHPRFKPPPGIRPLSRLALQITSGSNPMVRFEAYLAITSNTLQMGARATVKLTAGAFGVDGGGSFDTLIQWSPFHLEVDVAAWVRITAGTTTILSLNLALSVTGPAPWHLTGTAEFHVLFLSATVHVDLTLGASSTATAAVATVDLPGLVWNQVSSAASWEAALPASATPGALIGVTASDPSRVLAHPLATVSVRQKVAPLGLRISHVGANLPAAGPATLALSLTAPAGTVAQPVNDLFARAQYADVPAEQKLSAPSFESFGSGIRLQPAAAASAGPSTPCLAVVDTLDLTSFDGPVTPGAPAAAVVDSGSGR